jgi:hypothetical protein
MEVARYVDAGSDAIRVHLKPSWRRDLNKSTSAKTQISHEARSAGADRYRAGSLNIRTPPDYNGSHVRKTAPSRLTCSPLGRCSAKMSQVTS